MHFYNLLENIKKQDLTPDPDGLFLGITHFLCIDIPSKGKGAKGIEQTRQPLKEELSLLRSGKA